MEFPNVHEEEDTEVTVKANKLFCKEFSEKEVAVPSNIKPFKQSLTFQDI